MSGTPDRQRSPDKKFHRRAHRGSAAFRPHDELEKSYAHFCAAPHRSKPFSRMNFRVGEGLGRFYSAESQDGRAALGDSIVNGAGVALIVVREDLDLRRGGRVVIARCVDRAACLRRPSAALALAAKIVLHLAVIPGEIEGEDPFLCDKDQSPRQTCPAFVKALARFTDGNSRMQVGLPESIPYEL